MNRARLSRLCRTQSDPLLESIQDTTIDQTLPDTVVDTVADSGSQPSDVKPSETDQRSEACQDSGSQPSDVKRSETYQRSESGQGSGSQPSEPIKATDVAPRKATGPWWMKRQADDDNYTWWEEFQKRLEFHKRSRR